MKINIETLSKVALLAIGAIVIVTLNAYFSYIDLMAEKKIKTKHLVESTQGVIRYYYDKAMHGDISVDMAKKEAMSAIRNIRYGGNEYFWIQTNDIIPIMLMHATTPSLEGKTLDDKKFDCVTHVQNNLYSQVRDVDGITNLFVQISEMAKENGEGFIFYRWTKPQPGGAISKKTYPKISYFKEFKEWNWIVGSGIYVDDVKEGVLKNLLMTLLLAGLSILLWLKIRK